MWNTRWKVSKNISFKRYCFSREPKMNLTAEIKNITYKPLNQIIDKHFLLCFARSDGTAGLTNLKSD